MDKHIIIVDGTRNIINVINDIKETGADVIRSYENPDKFYVFGMTNSNKFNEIDGIYCYRAL